MPAPLPPGPHLTRWTYQRGGGDGLEIGGWRVVSVHDKEDDEGRLTVVAVIHDLDGTRLGVIPLAQSDDSGWAFAVNGRGDALAVKNAGGTVVVRELSCA